MNRTPFAAKTVATRMPPPAHGRWRRLGASVIRRARTRQWPTRAETELAIWNLTGRTPWRHALPRKPIRPSQLVTPLHVVAATNNLDLQGAPLVLVQILEALSNDPGLRWTVVSPSDGPLRQRLETAGIAVQVWPEARSGKRDRAAARRDLALLGRRLAEVRADVVWANTLDAVLVRLAATHVGLPALWVIHENYAWQPHLSHWGLTAVHETELLLEGGVFVFVSNKLARYYCLGPAARQAIVPNRIPPNQIPPRRTLAIQQAARRQLGLPDNALVALMIGTICSNKGQTTALRARAAVVAPARPIHLLVIGQGAADQPAVLAEVQAMAAAAGKNVLLAGQVPDVAPYLHAADALVMASENEAFSLVVLEAMAHGLAVIATPCFDEDLLESGIDTLAFTHGDHRMLATHLAQLAADPDLVADLGQRARARFEELSAFDQQVAQYRQLVVETAA